MYLAVVILKLKLCRIKRAKFIFWHKLVHNQLYKYPKIHPIYHYAPTLQVFMHVLLNSLLIFQCINFAKKSAKILPPIKKLYYLSYNVYVKTSRGNKGLGIIQATGCAKIASRQLIKPDCWGCIQVTPFPLFKEFSFQRTQWITSKWSISKLKVPYWNSLISNSPSMQQNFNPTNVFFWKTCVDNLKELNAILVILNEVRIFDTYIYLK